MYGLVKEYCIIGDLVFKGMCWICFIINKWKIFIEVYSEIDLIYIFGYWVFCGVVFFGWFVYCVIDVGGLDFDVYF